MRHIKENLDRRDFIKLSTIAFVAGASAAASGGIETRQIPPLVSPEWLSANLGRPELAVIDIRPAARYAAGHIPGSVNVPMSEWAVSRNGLTVELPSDEELNAALAKSGVSSRSHVVIVGRTETDFNRADATRVAWTCIIAGIPNVAVLNGGYNRWAGENRPVSTEPSSAQIKPFSGRIDRASLVSKEEVAARIGRAVIIDTRVPEDYFGIRSGEGHIRTALNLPAPWAFQTDGSYRSEEELRAMALGIMEGAGDKEVIIYCGVGGFAATWWFLLTQALGYRNVRLYDGSIEEWVKTPSGPVTRFSWK